MGPQKNTNEKAVRAMNIDPREKHKNKSPTHCINQIWPPATITFFRPSKVAHWENISLKYEGKMETNYFYSIEMVSRC